MVDYVLAEGFCRFHAVANLGVETGKFFRCAVGFAVDGCGDGLCFFGSGSMGLGGENELGNMLKVVFHIKEVGRKGVFDDIKTFLCFGAILRGFLSEGADNVVDVVRGDALVGDGCTTIRGDGRRWIFFLG